MTPSVPFHTLTIDFIVALPLTLTGTDSILTVTCKFTKVVKLVPGKTTWGAPEWATAFLDTLMSSDWGMPAVLISD